MKNIKNSMCCRSAGSAGSDGLPGSTYFAIPPTTATDNNAIIINNDGDSSTINLEYADSTHNGIVSILGQQFTGFKEFEYINSPIDSTNSSFGLDCKHSFGIKQGNSFYGWKSGQSSNCGYCCAYGVDTLKVNTANNNDAFGAFCLSKTIDGLNLSGFGNRCLENNTSGNDNCGFGCFCLQSSQTSGQTASFGAFSGSALVDGVNNSFFGFESGGNATNLNNCSCFGYRSGANYRTTESNNICIANAGVILENNTIRIGTSQNRCFIGGIFGISASSSTPVVVNLSGQLGAATVTFPSGSGQLVSTDSVSTMTNKTLTAPIISTISNTGTLTLPTGTDVLVARSATETLSNKTLANPTITGNINIPNTTSTAGAIVKSGARFLHSYLANSIYLGNNSGNFTMTGSGLNVAIGEDTLTVSTSGIANTVAGVFAMKAATTASNNTSIGYASLNKATTSNDNTCLGANSLNNLLTGLNNVCIGGTTGFNYTGAESNNIILGYDVRGTVGESQVIRIGNAQTKCFVQGIRGRTSDVADAISTLISSTGQLCTISSDRRLKENIVYQLQDKAKDIVSKLKPCMFNYIEDTSKKPVWGLIAQDVKTVPGMEQYVVKNKGKKEKKTKINSDGEVEDIIEEPTEAELQEETEETIQYQFLPIIMLKELQRIQKIVSELQIKNVELENKNTDLQTQINSLKK